MLRLYLDAVFVTLLLAATSAYQCFVCNNRPGDDDTEPCAVRVEECNTACSSVAMRDVKGRLHVRKFCTASGIPIYSFMSSNPGSSVCQNIQAKTLPQEVTPQISQPTPSIAPRTSFSNDVRPLTMSDLRAPPLNPVQTEFGGKPETEFFSARRHKRQLRSGFRPSFARPIPPGGRHPLNSFRPSSVRGQRPSPPSFFSNTLLCICTSDRCNKGDVSDMVQSTILKNIRDEEKQPKMLNSFF